MSHCGAQGNSDATLRWGCGAAGAGVAGRAVRAVPLMGLVPSRGRGPVAGAGPREGRASWGRPGNRRTSRARGRARASHSEGAAPWSIAVVTGTARAARAGIGCTMGTTRPAPRPLAVKSPIQAENHWSRSRTRPKRSCDPAARTDNLRIAHSILSVA
jgi:hypothetical protein